MGNLTVAIGEVISSLASYPGDPGSFPGSGKQCSLYCSVAHSMRISIHR